MCHLCVQLDSPAQGYRFPAEEASSFERNSSRKSQRRLAHVRNFFRSRCQRQRQHRDEREQEQEEEPEQDQTSERTLSVISGISINPLDLPDDEERRRETRRAALEFLHWADQQLMGAGLYHLVQPQPAQWEQERLENRERERLRVEGLNNEQQQQQQQGSTEENNTPSWMEDKLHTFKVREWLRTAGDKMCKVGRAGAREVRCFWHFHLRGA